MDTELLCNAYIDIVLAIVGGGFIHFHMLLRVSTGAVEVEVVVYIAHL